MAGVMCRRANDQMDYPWFRDDWTQYTGISEDFGPGDFGKVGCSVNCFSCSDETDLDFLGAVGSTAHGSRFLRPDDSTESRSASGRYDWPGGDARLIYIPWQAGNYQLAMCYKQASTGGHSFSPLEGRERWHRNICNCLPATQLPGPSKCVIPPDEGCEVSGFPAVTVFMHWSRDFPPSSQNMSCTGQLFAFGPIDVRLAPFRLDSPSIFRIGHADGGLGSRPSGGCSIHLNPRCTARARHSSGCLIPLPPGVTNLPLLQSPGDGGRAKWSALLIKDYRAAFRVNVGEPESQRAIVEAKNRVLNWMHERKSSMPERPAVNDEGDCSNSTPRSQNIDNPSRSQNEHDLWSSEWNGIIGPQCTTPQPLHAIAEDFASEMDAGSGDGGLQWDNCYLRKSGQKVRVQYVPIQIVVTIIAQWFNWRKYSPCDHVTELILGQIYPLFRVKIDVQMGVYAKFVEDDGSVNLDPHTLSNDLTPVFVVEGLPSPAFNSITYNIVNDESRNSAGRDWNGAGRYPEVLAVGFPAPEGLVDEIVYVDNSGRTIDGPPPDHWVWTGEMHIVRERMELFDEEWVDNQTNPTGCCALFRRLSNGIKVHASYSDPIWPETYHGSGVRMRHAPLGESTIEKFRTPLARGFVKVASICSQSQFDCNDCDGLGPEIPNPGDPCGGPNDPPCY